MAEEKSQAATPRRLQRARDEGRAPVSREVSMLLGLSAAMLALAANANGGNMAAWLARALVRTRYDGAQTWREAGEAVILSMAPAALAGIAGYVAGTLAQTGFLLHPAAIQPDLSRISPLAGIKRLVGPHMLAQTLKSIAKLAVLGGCFWFAMRHILPGLMAAPYIEPGALYRRVLVMSAQLALLLLGGHAVIAGADVAWERYHHAQQLRMSHQEVKDEHKDTEGNPKVKQRLRHLARARARRRMLKAVPRAAVVITNPTHYAVALAYERGSKSAPMLVAKGADEVAERIRDLAREHRIPIIANPPLARALFRIEVDTEIPAEHFRAVAEIIAYVWRMRARAARR
jgi:flagellar biosynthetic protein FlhB